MPPYVVPYSSHKTLFKPLKRLAITLMMVTFLWQANESLNKYLKGDTMMISKLRQLDKHVFPSVTICRSTVGSKQEEFKDQNMTETMREHFNLSSWLYSTFDGETQ